MKKVMITIFLITFFAIMATGPPLSAVINNSNTYTIDPAALAENAAGDAIARIYDETIPTTGAVDNLKFIITVSLEDACVCDKLSVLKCPDNTAPDFFLNAYDDVDAILFGRRCYTKNLFSLFTATGAVYYSVILELHSNLTPEVVDKTLTGLQPDGHNRQLWKRFEVGWNLARFYVSLDGVTRA